MADLLKGSLNIGEKLPRVPVSLLRVDALAGEVVDGVGVASLNSLGELESTPAHIANALGDNGLRVIAPAAVASRLKAGNHGGRHGRRHPLRRARGDDDDGPRRRLPDEYAGNGLRHHGRNASRNSHGNAANGHRANDGHWHGLAKAARGLSRVLGELRLLPGLRANEAADGTPGGRRRRAARKVARRVRREALSHRFDLALRSADVAEVSGDAVRKLESRLAEALVLRKSRVVIRVISDNPGSGQGLHVALRSLSLRKAAGDGANERGP
jgi:hypothetical protein